MQAWSMEEKVKPIQPIELAPSSLSTKIQAWPMENKVRPIQPIQLAPPPYEERKKLDMENSCKKCCWNAFQSKTFLLGLLELLLITIFVLSSIQNSTMIMNNNGIYPHILYPAVKSGFCAASVIMGVSLCATFWHKKKFLFTTYLYFGATRIWFCLLSVHYFRESLYLWNTRMMLLGLAVLFVGSWIIVYNKRQKSEWIDEHVAPPPYEERNSQASSRCSGHTARILASLFGVIEIVFGMLFLWLVYMGIIKQLIPLNSFLCTPLWVAMIAFGTLLPLNFIFKSKKIYRGYLSYSTIRLFIAIFFGIFLVMSLRYTRGRIQEINYEMNKINEVLNAQGNFQGHQENQGYHGIVYGRHKRENHVIHMKLLLHRNGNWEQQNSQQYQEAQDMKKRLELELNGGSDNLGLTRITRSYPIVLIVLACLCLISLVANVTVFTAFRKLN